MNIEKQKGFTTFRLGLIFILVYILAAIGYIMNIVKIVNGGIPDPMSIEMIIRCIGLLAVPIGVIMGFVPLGY